MDFIVEMIILFGEMFSIYMKSNAAMIQLHTRTQTREITVKNKEINEDLAWHGFNYNKFGMLVISSTLDTEYTCLINSHKCG